MKKYFVTGLIILMPVALTLMVIVFLFNLFTTPLVDLIKDLVTLIETKTATSLPPNLIPFVSRVLALIFLCLFILFLGLIARWFLVKNFIGLANQILSRIPIVKTVYKVSRDIVSALFSMDGKKAFKEPVMIPFPAPPAFGLGFHAGEVAEECQEKVNTPLVSVFFPTAPHPISGFLFLVPKQAVHKIDMTSEEVVKFLVSCGMIHPSSGQTPQKTE